MKTIFEIEKEMEEFIRKDKKTWIHIYQLMKEVSEQRLYEQLEGINSFTAWINKMAVQLHVHVSLLWARLKAGRLYDAYEIRKRNRGQEPVQLNSVAVSPDSIVLCKKVAGDDTEIMDDLLDKTLSGNIRRSDLRAAYRVKRGYEEENNTMPRISENDISLSDIVLALRKPDWIEKKNYARKGIAQAYHCFTGFPIRIDNDQSERNIDVLIVETVSAKEADQVVIRGVEIRNTVDDFIYSEDIDFFTDYVDFFYLAIPEERERVPKEKSLRIVCERVALPEWGILSVNREGKIKVIREAKKQDPVYREKTLSKCVVRFIQTEKN